MILSASTVFLGAFLLFQVQPMIAKMILPWFGGSAAVWITTMIFFQTALLGGYRYAHWSVRSLGPRSQSLIHGGLLGASLLLLPVTPSLAWKPSGSDEPIVLILRLLAYPFLVEPNVTLRHQSLGWSMAYGVFVLLGGIAAIAYGRNTTPESTATVDGIGEENKSRPPRTRDQLFWMVLAACASTFLLSVTKPAAVPPFAGPKRATTAAIWRACTAHRDRGSRHTISPVPIAHHPFFARRDGT